ncbi:hypothetical protein PoMZ_11120 [Pyricularia oryzae]|uniref:Uncharacterized protein n=1 Tax=Pyricularia oryzae TaxID=318829 RepID=A0A4P7NJK8_PYROR|nr:hypothetical protein PoMZ_11120 [Pyricularia oryzae]
MRITTHPSSYLSKPGRDVLSHLLLLRLIHLDRAVYLRLGRMHAHAASPRIHHVRRRRRGAASDGIVEYVMLPCLPLRLLVLMLLVKVHATRAVKVLLHGRRLLLKYRRHAAAAAPPPHRKLQLGLDPGASPGDAGAAVIAIALPSEPALLIRRGRHMMQLVPQWWCLLYMRVWRHHC